MRWRYYLPLSLFLALSLSCDRQGKGEESSIRARTDQYAKAYNKQDVKALGSMWANDGEFHRPDKGISYQGRNEIEGAYQSAFKERGDARLEIKVHNIVFPTSNEAVETGTAILTKAGEEIGKTVYKAVFEKKGGEWLIAQLKEIDFKEAPTNYQHLKELEWMIGTWEDKDDDSENTMVCAWDRYKNFITQHFTLSSEGVFELEGKQLIAWDPVTERIRSWVFDSDGGFGEGVWIKKGNSWVVQASQTLADGRRASSTNIYTPIDAGSYRWESTGREVDGELLPDIEPVIVKKVKG